MSNRDEKLVSVKQLRLNTWWLAQYDRHSCLVLILSDINSMTDCNFLRKSNQTSVAFLYAC